MKPLVSVVTPCYNEQDNVEACYQAVREIFAGTLAAYDHEHIFADNASQDKTQEILRRLAAADQRVKVILNARNFGVFPSMFNALLTARGDVVVACLAADLQDPPEVIAAMIRLWEQGYKVVYGIRQKRQESFVLRTFRHLFYRLVNRFSQTPLPLDAGEFQAIDRVVVEALRRFDDYYPYVRGMIASCGFRSTGVAYTWRARRRGVSKANWYHLFDVAMNAFVSFSNVPIRLSLLAGILIALASITTAIVQFVLAVLYPKAAAGVPTLIIALFFFSGVQLFFIGILGEYINAIHSQVRKRPLVIELERINYPAADSATPSP